MSDNCFTDRMRRKIIVTGHYGSGKTEFAVSLAMLLGEAGGRFFCFNEGEAEEPSPCFSPCVSVIDLDIVNPYFRSRERRELLENAGISVYGSVFENEITAELPALGASLRAPLENSSCRVIIDAGGNDTGALILNQFSKYFSDDDTTILAIINANRPDTSDVDGVLEHISAIEKITELRISGIVNNTHLLRETTADDIINGHTLCDKVSKATGICLMYNCYPEGIVDPGELTGLSECLMPLGLYMRPTWLDK